MAVASPGGLVIAEHAAMSQGDRIDATWFGEAPSRVVVAVEPAQNSGLMRRCADAEVPCRLLGHVGGQHLILGGARPIHLDELRTASNKALQSDAVLGKYDRGRLDG